MSHPFGCRPRPGQRQLRGALLWTVRHLDRGRLRPESCRVSAAYTYEAPPCAVFLRSCRQGHLARRHVCDCGQATRPVLCLRRCPGDRGTGVLILLGVAASRASVYAVPVVSDNATKPRTPCGAHCAVIGPRARWPVLSTECALIVTVETSRDQERLRGTGRAAGIAGRRSLWWSWCWAPQCASHVEASRKRCPSPSRRCLVSRKLRGARCAGSIWHPAQTST